VLVVQATFEKEHVDAQVWRLAGGAGKKRHQVVIAAHRLPFPATALNIDALQQISRRGHPSFVRVPREELLTRINTFHCIIKLL
jgi:hypothetical protein